MRQRERHKIYKSALTCSEVHGWQYKGLCFLIKAVTGDNKVYSQMKRYYPELAKHKPKEVKGDYWFSLNREGYMKRTEILKKAIRETKPKVSYKKTKTKAVKAKAKRKK